jgi:hypothetical protein
MKYSWVITHVSVKLQLLNVVVKWLTLLLRSWEVLNSNLGLETSYLGTDFHGFPQSLQVNSGKIPYIRPCPLASKSFPVHHLPVILSFNAIQQGSPQRGSSTSLVWLAQVTFNDVRVLRTKYFMSLI